jgi:hypothetical protein
LVGVPQIEFSMKRPKSACGGSSDIAEEHEQPEYYADRFSKARHGVSQGSWRQEYPLWIGALSGIMLVTCIWVSLKMLTWLSSGDHQNLASRQAVSYIVSGTGT